jgi:hypothetical protein
LFQSYFQNNVDDPAPIELDAIPLKIGDISSLITTKKNHKNQKHVELNSGNMKTILRPPIVSLSCYGIYQNILEAMLGSEVSY